VIARDTLGKLIHTETISKNLGARVTDLYQSPAFHFDADLDPDPDPTFQFDPIRILRSYHSLFSRFEPSNAKK
jgi:hypothetical protein